MRTKLSTTTLNLRSDHSQVRSILEARFAVAVPKNDLLRFGFCEHLFVAV